MDAGYPGARHGDPIVDTNAPRASIVIARKESHETDLARLQGIKTGIVGDRASVLDSALHVM